MLSLISVLLPWWGITTTVFGSSTSTMWGFFGAPSHNSDINGVSNFSSTITTYSPIILALVLISTALGIMGSFITRHRFLASGLVTSIAALVGYAALIGYATSNSCQGPGCITQPTGSVFIPNASVNWGFQQGFYLFTAATILLLVGLVFHQTLTRSLTKGQTLGHKAGFCANCGAKLPSGAKFCASCAHPVAEDIA